MTAAEVLAEFDRLEPSDMTVGEKLLLLNELEGRLWRDLYGAGRGEEPPAPLGEEDLARPLLCTEPEGFGLYLSFLCMRTALVQGESDRYTRWGTLFNELNRSLSAAVSRREAGRTGDWRF